MVLAYCDYIAAMCSEKLRGDIGSFDTVVAECGMPQLDLHPEEGYFMSTKKTIDVKDINGKKYRITVEEVE